VSDYLERQKSIIEMTHEEARAFLLKGKSYCRFDLPKYIKFDSLLADIDGKLNEYRLSDISNRPDLHENVNYTIYDNKDGKYAWRPMQLINPVLYVGLVHELTSEANWEIIRGRFNTFHADSKIECLSLPQESLTDESDQAEQVHSWWTGIEQKSIELSLDYDYLVTADITDCYGSIYTHSIAWAVHTKEVAKIPANRNNVDLIGVTCDKFMQKMSNGQTNGLPQGSVLIDLLSELVLGYIDSIIIERINSIIANAEFRILRYRDDYRIFTESSMDAEIILKILTEVLIDFGLKLNSKKTVISTNVVRSSIKDDKLSWINKIHRSTSLQKTLLIIHSHAHEHNNAGSLVRALFEYYKVIKDREIESDRITPLISILVDIGYNNPRTIPIVAASISTLFSKLESEEIKRNLFNRIQKRFSKRPNTGFVSIWLQRVIITQLDDISFSESICNLVQGQNQQIWNTDWITSNEIKRILDPHKIIDRELLSSAPNTIEYDEIALFIERSGEVDS
jgi:RNA-directed DNA polymerase